MADGYVSVQCPDEENCGEYMTFGLTGEPADRSVGIMSDSFSVNNEPPSKCPHCGKVFTTEEIAEIAAEAERLANNYIYEPDVPEWEPDDDR